MIFEVELIMREKGFTLIELMITLAIAAILLTVAVPSFQSLIENNRLATNVNQVITILHYLKSEAVKRNVAVSLCAGNPNNGCACNPGPGCNATWKNGYIVFTDPNVNCTVDQGDQILQAREGIRGDYTITAVGCLTFRALGNLSANNTVTISICTSNLTADNIRDIVINPVGRPNVQKRTGTC